MARRLAILVLVAISAGLALLPDRPEAAREPRAGDLDPSFGRGGKVLTDFGRLEAVEDLVVQRDGKIVAVGSSTDPTTFRSQFVLVRYRRGGSLDTSFGVGGSVTTEFEERASGSANAVALQGDGKIVAAGSTGGGPTGFDIAVARYNPDGRLDPSFGSGGRVVTDFNLTNEAALGVAVQTDGKLVVVGSSRSLGGTDVALARYEPNGSLDRSFAGDGKVTAGFPDWDDLGEGIALAKDGKILTAGTGFPDRGSGPAVIGVARFNTDGSLDGSFDGDGWAPRIPGGHSVWAVIVQPDGRVVAAGSGSSGLALFRYTVAGRPDATFGEQGVASAGYGPHGAGAFDLARQPDGKLVAVGVADSAPDLDESAFAVARFLSSGKLDRSFHGGTISTDFGAGDWAQAVALQADGRIVVGGFSGRRGSGGTLTAQDFAIARYLGAASACKVPNVVGKRLGAAGMAITKAHCRVGTVRRRASKKVERGRVISQSPKPRKRLQNRGRVDLVVSRGPRSVRS